MSRRAWILDVGVALATIGVELALLLDDGSASAAALGATVAAGGALALRRLAPLAVLVFVLAAAIVIVAVGEAPAGAAALIALGTTGAYSERRHALTALALGVVVVTVLSAVNADRDGPPAAVVVGVLASGALAAGSWSIGAYLRAQREHRNALETRAELLEREREQLARLAVHEERAAIARELHDIVAHSVGTMLLGVRGARDVLHAVPELADRTLASVEKSGERSVTELQRILTLLRAPDASAAMHPQPSVADIPRLVDDHRATGLSIQLEQPGSPIQLPPGVELAAYRIVQEALTNAHRHAAPTRVTVRLAHRAAALDVTVENDGSTAIDVAAGHGLTGMRERVALLSGELQAGPAPGGGFRVIARLPIGET